MEAPRCGEEVENGSSALVVRPRTSRAAARVPCLVGPRGTGKTSLAVAIAEALGRAYVRVALDEHHTAHLIRGKEGDAPGRIVRGLRETGVRNPVFILELLDEVRPEVADALLDVLDPVVGTAFQDQYLQLRFDLSAVLWIVTATDPGAIPEQMGKRLEVIELPGYTEQEKLAIAEQYLLKRPFDVTLPVSAGCLAPEPAASSSIVEADTGPAGPVLVAECEVSSMAELDALSAEPPFPAADAWRTAASEGGVRFETEAIRQVIRDHTDEAGLTQLNAKLALICRQAMKRRPPGNAESEVITPAAVREMLGNGAADALPPVVREAIARERHRLGDKPDGDAERTNGWIEWLEQLPWTRSDTAAIDLTSVRAALDAGHAGLEHAKARILEYLAVRRRNPLGTGAVICFSGPPGVGKTSLAQCTAKALGRGFVKLACGGLHDETDLRGHNRTWRDAQPGSILREMRRVGSNDPVFVLDEIDKLGPAPAAVLLEVLDPAQNDRFRDSFVELPFDLSAVLFITTANEVARIPPALRDRLDLVDLPGYIETEKIAIAETHLIPAQNRAAGLTAAPMRFTRGACRRIIRDYTSERGIRQLTRCLQTVCRKVALGLETGDAALIRNRITAAQVRTFLGAPAVDPTDGLDRLRKQVDAPGMPDAVRERGRVVLERLATWPRTDPERARAREYLRCLASLPWTKHTAAPLDLARARTVLDAGHAGHGAVKEHLVDYIAVRLTKPDATAPLLCLLGPAGVGKTSLARLLAAALGRARAWVPSGELNDAAGVHGTPSGPPGRIVEELRRVGVRNPVFVLDEVDRLDDGSGTAAALLEAIAPALGAAFRDRYVDLPFNLAESLFVATANSLGSVPAVLRETMSVIELPGYTAAESGSAHSARRKGVYYTPLSAVSLVLNEVFDGLTGEETVMDLTCGSGVFLVEALRRLVRLKARGGTPSRKTIRETLYTQVYGVDDSEPAVRIAAFSLYLAALDIDPDPQPPEALTFEPLQGKTLLVGDARTIEETPDGQAILANGSALKRFDVIVGNPPWSYKGKAGTAARRAAGSEAPQQPRGESLDFVARARDFAHDETRFGMVLSAMPFFGRSGTAAGAVRDTIEALVPVTLINLSDLSGWLFPKAGMPAIALLARHRGQRRDRMTLVQTHWSRAGEQSHTIEVAPSDITTLPIASWKRNPGLFKAAFLGRRPDMLLLDGLWERHQSLEVPPSRSGYALQDRVDTGQSSPRRSLPAGTSFNGWEVKLAFFAFCPRIAHV